VIAFVKQEAIALGGSVITIAGSFAYTIGNTKNVRQTAPCGNGVNKSLRALGPDSGLYV